MIMSVETASGSLDAVDRAILGLLQEDGRIANVDLAEAVHLSPSACLRRVRRLEESGRIDRYVALLDSTNRYLSRDTALDRQEFIHLLEQRENVKLDSAMRFLQEFQEEHNAIAIEEQARAVIRAAAEMQMAAMELAIKKLSLLRSGFARPNAWNHVPLVYTRHARLPPLFS
mgnify:CR=1 FL=1